MSATANAMELGTVGTVRAKRRCSPKLPTSSLRLPSFRRRRKASTQNCAGDLRWWGDGVFNRAHGIHMAPDDTVYLTESPDGFRLTPYDPDFGAQIAVAEKVLKRRRAALRELAK